MSDETELLERKKALENDKREQARWLESLNLLAEALRIYTSINDSPNVERVKRIMAESYGSNALKLEAEGLYQEAANLYFLAGDMEGVRRMKVRKPDLVILYDSKDGGLARFAKKLDDIEGEDGKEVYFSKPNVGQDTNHDINLEKGTSTPKALDQTQRTVVVKMPKQRKALSFCPYCGEKLQTAKEPRFCPYCGEELK